MPVMLTGGQTPQPLPLRRQEGACPRRSSCPWPSKQLARSIPSFQHLAQEPAAHTQVLHQLEELQVQLTRLLFYRYRKRSYTEPYICGVHSWQWTFTSSHGEEKENMRETERENPQQQPTGKSSNVFFQTGSPVQQAMMTTAATKQQPYFPLTLVGPEGQFWTLGQRICLSQRLPGESVLQT